MNTLMIAVLMTAASARAQVASVPAILAPSIFRFGPAAAPAGALPGPTPAVHSGVPGLLAAPALTSPLPAVTAGPLRIASPGPLAPRTVLSPKALLRAAAGPRAEARRRLGAAFDGALLKGGAGPVFVPEPAQAAEARRLGAIQDKRDAERVALERLRGDGFPLTEVEYAAPRTVALDDPHAFGWAHRYRSPPRIFVAFADAETALRYREALPRKLGEALVLLKPAQAEEAERLARKNLAGLMERRALEELRGLGIPVRSVTYLPPEKRIDKDPDSLRWPKSYRTAPRLVVRFRDAEAFLKYRDALPLRLGEAALRAEAGDAVSAGNIPGTYTLEPADGRRDRAAELRIEADGSYAFRRSGLAMRPVLRGTWRFEGGRFVGELRVPGARKSVVHEIDLRGLLLPEIERGAKVRATLGSRSLIYIMKKAAR